MMITQREEKIKKKRSGPPHGDLTVEAYDGNRTHVCRDDLAAINRRAHVDIELALEVAPVAPSALVGVML